MSTSAAAAAGTVRLYCSDCSTGFSLPAPSSPFDFTLCPRCRRGYLDDRPAPYPLPPPMWPSSPSSRSSRSAMLPQPPPPPPWIHSWSSSSSTTTLPPLPPPPPPPLPRGSSSPSPSSPSAMLPPPPPPLLWIPSSSPFSSTTTLPPPPPPPCVPSSSASSSSPKTLPRTPPSPCTRASSSSTGLPPPPPPTTSSGTTTSSAAPVLYYCPEHFAVATRKEPPFPLSTLERCPSCRVHDFHNDAEHPVSSSTTVSPISSTYSSASSSPLWLPPPPPPPPPPELYQGELQPGSPPLTMERTDFVDANVGLQPSPTLWITRLPVITVANNEVLCANCTNPILGRGRRLPCGHQYHTSCIMPWLLRRNSCPVWGCQCSVQGSSPPPPPRPPSLTSMPSNTWDWEWGYFSSPSAEEPPVSIYASLIDSPVHRGGSQAAPAASIAALPTVIVSDTAEVCIVCTEPLPLATAARRLPCGHLYHSECIVSWLSRHNSCPVCRRSIPMFPSTTAETALPPPPPLSIYASLIDSPVHRGGSQAAPAASIAALPTVTVSDTDSPVHVHRGRSQAAPAASIAALPTVTVSDTAEVCVICTEPFPLASAARRLPCGHLYHSACIVSWLSRHNSCPVCRRSIPMFPSPTAETAPSPSLPQPTPGRRRSLPGVRRIRRICHRLLRYMEISRARQPNRSGNIVHG